MLYSAKEKTLSVQGSTTRYITFGKGEKTLIMIQGLNTRSIKGAAFPLALMYKCFARDYTVYLFDRRDTVPENITVRELAQDLAEYMDALGLKNADVFGASEGGMIAQYLAIDRPDLVRALVLAVTLSRNNATVESVINGWIEMTEKGDFKRLTTDMAEKMYSDAYLKRYKPFLPLLTLLQKPRDKARFISLARSCLTCNTFGELNKIKCPVLVIGGAQDKIVGIDASYEIAERLGCEIYVYKDLGHAAYEEAKDFNSRVLDFFRKVR